MTKILEVAKSFELHAKQQSEATEKAVLKEFEKLRGVIERESASAQITYENAIQSLNRKHWTHSTLRALPLTVLVMLAVLGTSATWGWYVFGSKTRHLTTIETADDGSKWAACKKTYHDQKDKTNQQPTYCLLE
jgi:hypothetical protein